MKHVPPRQLDRYAVRVNERYYPPKQIVAISLELPVTQFTTMDASRILTALGFKIEEVRQVRKELLKNESELLFEAYLKASGVSGYVFEKELPGTTRRPDYAVPWGGREILFELKEFRAEADDLRPGFGAYDPYGPLREKIEAGRKKFKDLDGYCCCLVLYNRDKPLVHLEWQFVYGAMLGNVGFSVPIHMPGQAAPMDKEIRSIFTAGGKMHRERDGVPIEPQNQTISAILVLQHVRVGERRFMADLRNRERERGKKFELEEFWEELRKARGTERDVSLRQLRVIVHENPYARVPLTRELFRGPYDERYGGEDGRIQRLFEGDEIARLPEVD